MAPWRRRRAAAWTELNEVLPGGEPGYERDTGKLKVGDGLTAWNDLPYFGEGAPPDNGGDDTDVFLPEGVPTYKGIYDPAVQYKAGDMVKSAGVAWIALEDNIGELPKLPLGAVQPISALAQSPVSLDTKPYAAPYLPFRDTTNWTHEYRYFDINPGGTVTILCAGANVGDVRLLDARDENSPNYGQVLYNSQSEGVPVGNLHSVHNLQPGRYVVDKNVVDNTHSPGQTAYVPEGIISGTNGAVIWGAEPTESSWVALAPPVS